MMLGRRVRGSAYAPPGDHCGEFPIPPLLATDTAAHTGSEIQIPNTAVLKSRTPPLACLPKARLHQASSWCSLPNPSHTELLLMARPWPWRCLLVAGGVGEPLLTSTQRESAHCYKFLRHKTDIQNKLAMDMTESDTGKQWCSSNNCMIMV